MGSFIGHIDEALAMVLLGLWWMYKAFTKHVKTSSENRKYEVEVSYYTYIRGRAIPLEQIFKILFPAIAIFGELVDSKLIFRSRDGQMRGVNYLMHVSIYGLFIIHGVVDWMKKKGCRFIPPKTEYITAAIAFGWYATGMFFHAHMERKTEFENLIHFMLTFPLFAMSATVVVIAMWPSSFPLDFFRCFLMLLLGTWVTHSSFLLFIPGIPGTHKNPVWDRGVYQNVHYIPVAFGIHVGFDLTFSFFFYAFCYWIVTRRNGHKPVPYLSCPDALDDTELSQKLLSNDEFQSA